MSLVPYLSLLPGFSLLKYTKLHGGFYQDLKNANQYHPLSLDRVIAQEKAMLKLIGHGAYAFLSLTPLGWIGAGVLLSGMWLQGLEYLIKDHTDKGTSVDRSNSTSRDLRVIQRFRANSLPQFAPPSRTLDDRIFGES